MLVVELNPLCWVWLSEDNNPSHKPRIPETSRSWQKLVWGNNPEAPGHPHQPEGKTHWATKIRYPKTPPLKRHNQAVRCLSCHEYGYDWEWEQI